MTRYETRRKDRMITEEEALQLLKDTEYGILTTVDEDGMPYGVPISYVLLDHKIYCHSTNQASHKLTNIGDGCKASFTVVDHVELQPGQFTTKYMSAMAFGRASIVEDRVEKEAALKAIVDKYASTFMAEGLAFIGSLFKQVAIIRLDIEYVSGKGKKK